MATSWPVEGGAAAWSVYRGSQQHINDWQGAAVDLCNDQGAGTGWLALADGICLKSAVGSDAGWYADIQFSWDGELLIARYCHANISYDVLVQAGEPVVAGQLIGLVGCKGFVRPSATPPNSHLHLWIRRPDDTRVWPEAILDVIAATPDPPQVVPYDAADEAIRAYVQSRGDAIGSPVDNGGGSNTHDWDGLRFQDLAGRDERAQSTAGNVPGLVIVVAGPNGPKLVRNAFYDQYLGQTGSQPTHVVLGRPLDEEYVENGQVVQHFEGARMVWDSVTGATVEIGG